MEADDAATRARFERLFDAHYGELTRFAMRRVGPDAAGDAVSSTFLVAGLAASLTSRAAQQLCTTITC